MNIFKNLWDKIWSYNIIFDKNDTINKKLLKFIIIIIRIVYNTIIKYIKDDGINKAASLSFTLIISFIPILMVAYSIMSSFSAFDELKDDLLTYFFTEAFPAVGEQLRTAINDFLENSKQIRITAVIFLFFTATSMFRTLEGCLENIWKIRNTRSIINKFVNFYLVISLGPLLLAVSFFFLQTQLPKSLKIIFPTLVVMTLFFLIYILIPNVKVKFQSAFMAALIAGILFELAKWGFAKYSVLIGSRSMQDMYGDIMWILPIFFLWIYLSFMIILIGAELSYVIQNYKRIPKLSLSINESDMFNHTIKRNYLLFYSFCILKTIYDNFYQNKGETSINEIDKKLKSKESQDSDIINEAMYLLVENKIIKELNEDEFKTFLPYKALEKLNIKQLIEVLRIEQLHNESLKTNVKEILIQYNINYEEMLNKKYENKTLYDLLY